LRLLRILSRKRVKGSKKSRKRRMMSNLKNQIKMSNSMRLTGKRMTPILKNVFSNEKSER